MLWPESNLPQLIVVLRRGNNGPQGSEKVFSGLEMSFSNLEMIFSGLGKLFSGLGKLFSKSEKLFSDSEKLFSSLEMHISNREMHIRDLGKLFSVPEMLIPGRGKSGPIGSSTYRARPIRTPRPAASPLDRELDQVLLAAVRQDVA